MAEIITLAWLFGVPTLVIFPVSRDWLKRRVFIGGSFNPNSRRHLILLALILTYHAAIMISALAGTVTVPDEPTPIDTGRLAVSVLMWLGLCFALIGLGTGRTPGDAARRLGFTRPTAIKPMVQESAIILAILIPLSALIGWLAQSANPDLLSIQVAYDSIFIVFAVALSTAVVEETLYRGAIQPALGNISTSALFALAHGLYFGFFPALLLMFVFALALGYLRSHYNSVLPAIGVHFLFNALPLAAGLLIAV